MRVADDVAPTREEHVEMLAQFPRPAHVELDVRTTAMVFWRSAAQAAERPFDTAATILDYTLKNEHCQARTRCAAANRTQTNART
jgi:hypothetical protein